MSLRVRLALLMALLTVVPALCAALLSRQLIDRGFDLGLSQEVDGALAAGVRRARSEHREARARLEEDVRAAVGRLSRSITLPDRVESVAPAAVRVAIDPPPADAVTLVHESGATVPLQEGRRDPEPELAASDDTPTHLSHEEIIDGRWRLRWRRPAVAQWRQDASDLASTLQLVRGVKAQREEWERSFWLPFIVVYLVALALGLAVALRVGRGITTPVRRLLEGTDAVAAGRWDIQLPAGGTGEIRTLTRRFNSMVRTLDAQSRRLIDLETMAGWREMARALAHEVKNPLTPIQLTVEEMRERYQGDDTQYRELLHECSRIVVEEVDSLRSVVSRFREFSRPVELRPRPADLGRLVDDVAALQRDLVVEVERDAALTGIELDEDRFRQLFMNLCENSRKAMAGAAEPRLLMTAHANGEAIDLSVEDAGPGIPPEERDRVFEPYQTGGAGGLGLGLALVKGIVLAHHGSIEVETSRLGGASFRIRLPRVQPASQHEVST